MRGWQSIDHRELYRLARLGLWAENRAIPAIEHWAKDGRVASMTSGHGESCDAISFYDGLMITPAQILSEVQKAENHQCDKCGKTWADFKSWFNHNCRPGSKP